MKERKWFKIINDSIRHQSRTRLKNAKGSGFPGKVFSLYWNQFFRVLNVTTEVDIQDQSVDQSEK